MASQALYRRYRPRRFAEIKGQGHVVAALRDAVAEGREGQAYLFSGPRGTGKTTSARILAKVLNCENPTGGEPCCECTSCRDVERGVSYDVHELDAASNNGVDAMRDLIEKAQLGSPGRHKVYILDEVHMLSKAAEAALLKTLEEPPDHVVFVLATTDPQKVSETIRSRTQHLRFHLLPPDVLAEHARWVADDAGLDLDDDAVAAAIAQGGGSARDTLSALELIANSGGASADLLQFDDVVTALIDHDPGLALTAIAGIVNHGHDPRTVAEELVKHLRNGFLALMAPDLVGLPAATLATLTDQATRLGAGRLVAAIERLGTTLVDMRHAPDPRVLVEVSLVALCRQPDAAPAAGGGGSDDAAPGLAARVAKLEQALASGAATAAPAPVDPSTGRAKLGGRARRPASAERPASGASAPASAEPAADAATPPDAAPEPAAAAAQPATPPAPEPTAPAPAAAAVDLAAEWEQQIRPTLRGLARPLFAAVDVADHDASTITFSAPNPAHQARCADHVDDVRRTWKDATGRDVTIAWSSGDGSPPPAAPASAPTTSAPSATAANPPRSAPKPPPVTPPASAAARPTDDEPPPSDESFADDYDEPDDSQPTISGAASVLDRVAEAFPGAERITPTDDPSH